jgi:hypothetical protein
VLGGYMNIICTVFYPTLLDDTLPFASGSESEKEVKHDEEIGEILLKILILY